MRARNFFALSSSLSEYLMSSMGYSDSSGNNYKQTSCCEVGADNSHIELGLEVETVTINF
jgi:hypothetical protein